MPVLKNVRWEKFAQNSAKGMPDTKAYEAAGYKPNDGNCGRLRRFPEVMARIAEIQGRAAEKTIVTIAQLTDELEEARVQAKGGGAKGASAMVAATMGKAKLHGLIVERQAGADGGPIQVIISSDDAKL